ncbi:hypothetical protein H5410_052604 [Solanum commersonii]|uniref:RRM domain-containing protein n=1 Tax=Solanum commersonii TaxID=4109 RepID=A0A9J5X199_SOLCO|nr:hypothetical protein H5410_052604 [Solanum commersonii]
MVSLPSRVVVTSRYTLFFLDPTYEISLENVLSKTKTTLSHDGFTHHKLFIGRPGLRTTSETLHRIFSAYGEIKDAFVVRDKFDVSKEYGFVIFKNIRSMLMALKEPYKSLDGKMTITKIARSRIRDVEDESLQKGPFGFDKETGKSRGHNLTCEMAIPKTMMKNPHVGPNLEFDFGPGLHDRYNNAKSRFDGCSSKLEVSQKKEKMVFPSDSQLQNPISGLVDGLYCDEDHRFLYDDLDDDELATLLSKEKEFHLCFQSLISDGSRKEALDWMLRVISYYNFTATTAVLAVNYFDRFVSELCFQKDKPWLSQLAAVACLSIAAKMEETQVPLLLDLQVADSRFVFEAKTIQRMELLMLSTLNWKMNLVTPLSFIHHITRRFGFTTNQHLYFLNKCERLVLDIITDSRHLHYSPSVIATASMFYVINEIEPNKAMEYQNQLMRRPLEECHDLIHELMGTSCYNLCQSLKRKHHSVPGSPSGVTLVAIARMNHGDQ